MADEKDNDGMHIPPTTAVIAAGKVIHVTIGPPGMSTKDAVLARRISDDHTDRKIKTVGSEDLLKRLNDLSSVLASSAAWATPPPRHDFCAQTPGAAPSDSPNQENSPTPVLGQFVKSSSNRLDSVPEVSVMQPVINGVVEGIKSLHHVLTRPDIVNQNGTDPDIKVLVHHVYAHDVLFDFGDSGRRCLGRYKGNDEMLSRICNLVMDQATVERLSVRPIGTRADIYCLITNI
jgi:hypothetical protein